MQRPPPPGWDDTILLTVEKQLARFLGPMARVIIRKAAAKTTQTAALYALAAESISDADERRKFMAEMPGTPTPTTTTTNTGMSGTQPISVRKGQTAPPQVRSQSGGTRPVVPIPLDQGFVDQTTTRLAVYLGPLAKVVARKAAQKAGTQQEFVQLVAAHLGVQERGAFLRELGFDDAV